MLALLLPAGGGLARAQDGPPEGCIFVEQNGDFESDSAWEFAQTTSPGFLDDAVAHSGKQSAFVGIPADGENQEVDTTVWQEMQLPEAEKITLQAWMRTRSGDANDMRYVVVWDLATDDSTVLLYEPASPQDWQQVTLDMTDFAGKNILLVFGVHNDGEGELAGMWVDEVHVIACGGNIAVTPTPTATAVPTETPTPKPTPTVTPTLAPLQPTATSAFENIPTAAPEEVETVSAVTETPTPATADEEATPTPLLPTVPPPPASQPPPPPSSGGLMNSNAMPLLVGIFLSGLIAVAVVAINLRR